jgi:tetratricopeptide (TPR) repeat protein
VDVVTQKDCKIDGIVSRDKVPVIDKAIKLTWTLRDDYNFAFKHLCLLERRGALELCNGAEEEGNRRVSDIILGGLRRLKWPPRTRGVDKFRSVFFNVLMVLHVLGVHQEAAEELFFARYPVGEEWGLEEGHAAVHLSKWIWALLEAASERETSSEGERMALLGRAKEIAARAVPLLGGPWGQGASKETCEVRTVGWGRCCRGRVRRSDVMPCSQFLGEVAGCFKECEEYELSVRFAEAEMALAESLGQRGESLPTLMHGLHAWGKLKESEQHHRAYLVRADVKPYNRAVGLNSLSRVLRDQGRLSEALEKAEEATSLAETAFKSSAPLDNPCKWFTFYTTCHMTEASILERMGRLKEAIAKEELNTTTSAGQAVRLALAAVVDGRLEEARDFLRRILASTPQGDHRRNIEGPDLTLRAQELMWQVLHRLRKAGKGDPGDEAEEAALRAELRHEEVRRGEALSEVRALIRRAAGEEGRALTAAPKTSRRRKKKKGKRGRRSRATAAAAQEEEEEEEEEEATGDAATPAAENEALAVGQAPPVGDEGLQVPEEEGEDKGDCPVCLHPLAAEEGEEGGVGVLGCGHEYHVTCMDAWVSTCVRKRLDVTCPSCRAPVDR